MSETPRTFARSKGPIQVHGSQGRVSGPLPKFVIFVLFFLLLVMLWTTRDSHPVEEFVAADRSAHVVIPDLMQDRARVAASQIWKGLPEAAVSEDFPEWLQEDFGLPDWVLMNLVGGSAFITANDLSTYSDRLIVVRMTRVGCLIERLNRIAPGIRRDWAGGLALRRMRDAGLYYAVRGRTLIVSPSRDEVVQALVLEEEDRLDVEVVREMLAQSGPEDIRGTLVPAESEGWEQSIQSVSFAARINSDETHVKVQLSFHPEWQARIAESIGRSEPRKLAAPYEGPLSLSANFGVSAREATTLMGDLFGIGWMSSGRWDRWADTSEGETASSVLTSLVGPMGPEFRLTWLGVDLNAMAPLPLFVGSLQGDAGHVEQIAGGLARSEASSAYLEARAHFDEESDWLYSPIEGSPSLEPAAQWRDDRLIFGMNRTLTDSYFLEPALTEAGDGSPAHLYLIMKPGACMEALVSAGRNLASNSLLEGYTVEEFRKESAVWLEKATVIDSVSASLTFVDGKAEIDLILRN